MASLKDLRRRIASVKNTRQITSAMKLVAASKLRRAQQAIVGAKPYAERIEGLVLRLAHELTRKFEGESEDKKNAHLLTLHPLLKQPDESNNKVALIVISSDRGLCGAYNANAGKRGLKAYRELVAQGKEVDLYFYGKKAYDSFRRAGLNGQLVEKFWGKTLNPSATNKVADVFVQKYLDGDYARVDAVFTEFKSAMSQIVQQKSLLPLKLDVNTATHTKAGDADAELPFIYEPSREELLASLLPKQIFTQFYRIFAECYASEMGSRMTAMENATKNAGEMIASLTLLANRTRQASITKDLIEIVSGAETLKG